jgi:hypothetical protein
LLLWAFDRDHATNCINSQKKKKCEVWERKVEVSLYKVTDNFFFNLPIVPAPDDYDDGEFGGMKIGRGNRSAWRKPAPVPLWSPQIPLEPGPPRWEASD